MIKNKINLLIIGCACTVMMACHSPENAVSSPEGWQVTAFACTYFAAGNLERLSIDGENFEHMREGQVRGQLMRIVIKGSAGKATIQVTWISPTGQERHDPPVPIGGVRARKLFEEYKTKYFLLTKFPNENLLENLLTQKYGKPKHQVFLCNRRAYRFTHGLQVVDVDAKTGIELAVYQTTSTGSLQTIKQLLQARWELRRGHERGYCEIHCNK
ncbi:MAG: hypothetical protein KatS3mg017_0024 [Fimbriimonadales bacterium]|nr:MAG: hypothetical protein KatS3mg017_0024 [Fimbriimonadales bacterium]